MAETTHTLTVLSVDDSTVVQELIKRALGNQYRVLLADNAVDALAMISQESVAAILLDVSMPDIDGLDFCRTVRSIPQFQALPIIMVTARDRAYDKVQGRLAGATEYLIKPFDAEQLVQTLAKLLHPAVLPAPG